MNKLNTLINEMTQILNITPADMVTHMLDLADEYEDITPKLVARSLLHTAFCCGVNSVEHQKCSEIYNEYNRTEL